ncbi:O-antigen ligase family protein [Devosia sp. 1566]|uniref:O-antigen ligase family protein n=1 Tax=Devosia sp. 1566 TaxID=2499144 RepID=UPI000FDCD566|nr:O-antigen ligase family protein [Devosia sp. 1566]
MLRSTLTMLAWCALVCGLTLPTLAPGAANMLTLVLMGVGLTLLPTAEGRGALGQPATWLPLVAGGLMLLAIAGSAREPMSFGAIIFLVPLFLAAPHAALVEQLGARLTLTAVGTLALLGAIAGAVVAGFDVFVMGEPRGGVLVNNPIHLADLALTLGFVAAVGVLSRWRWRAVFLLGPLAALLAIWFSGSRGPLVAFVPMSMAALAGAAVHYLPRRRAWLLIGCGAVAALLVFAVLIGTGWIERTGPFGEIVSLFRSGEPGDDSTSQRLIMYRSALAAFMASPVWGHGLGHFMEAAAQFAPPGARFPKYDHLHNDIADFAVSGGLLGLLSYGLILLAPFAGAWRAQGSQRAPALYLALVASVGYAGMGLTNAMFGVLAQTLVYTVLLSLIAVLASRPKESFP